MAGWLVPRAPPVQYQQRPAPTVLSTKKCPPRVWNISKGATNPCEYHWDNNSYWIISFMTNFFFHLRYWLILHQTASIFRAPGGFVPCWPSVLPWLHSETRAVAQYTVTRVTWPLPTAPAASLSVTPPLIQMHRHHWPDFSPSSTPNSISFQEAFSLPGTLFLPPNPPRGCLLL